MKQTQLLACMRALRRAKLMKLALTQWALLAR
jgi:hypothetical protein